jgi:hypothetical protein
MPTEPTEVPFGDGRDAKGRFTKGNAGGPGNPLGGKVARLRSALVEAVTEEDIQAIAARLVTGAREGDLAATRELLLRTLGRPLEPDILQRLERLEELMERSQP